MADLAPLRRPPAARAPLGRDGALHGTICCATTPTCCGRRGAATTTATGSRSARSTPREVLATAYWAYDALLMTEIAEVLGHARSRGALRAPARRASSPPSTRAYVGEDAYIEGDTQTVYLLALHMELLPEELRPRAAERLVENIARHDGHLTTGLRRRRPAVPGAERVRLQRRRARAAAQGHASRPGATRSATARPRSGSAGTAGPRTPASRPRR